MDLCAYMFHPNRYPLASPSEEAELRAQGKLPAYGGDYENSGE